MEAVMKIKLFVVLSITIVFLTANPIMTGVINEFQTDTIMGQKFELFNWVSGNFPLIGTEVTTPGCSAEVDVDSYLPANEYAAIDTAMLSGSFFLPLDDGSLDVYQWDGFSDQISYSQNPSALIPAPPAGASTARFFKFRADGQPIFDWYIDYSPTLGYANDDYTGCLVSGAVYSNFQPVQGAQVTASCLDIYQSPEPYYVACTTYTSDSGLYMFDSLLPSRYWIAACYSGYGPQGQQTPSLRWMVPLADLNFYFFEITESNNGAFSNSFASPNPFHKKTRIYYALDTKQQLTGMDMRLKIYNASGGLVKSFDLPSVYSILPGAITWDGTDEAGKNVCSGIYFISVPGQRLKVIKL
jgi:hypothetical protein